MWRLSGLLLGALFLCGSAVWWARVEGAGTESADAVELAPVRLPAVTAPAAKATPLPAGPPSQGPILYDPVVVSSCNLVPLQEQDVSSQIDAEFRDVLVDLGSQVKSGEVLGRLDDRQLRPQVDLLQIKATSRAAELIAKAQHDEAAQRVQYALKANKSGLRSVSELEYQTYF